jgi:hypothetical protein
MDEKDVLSSVDAADSEVADTGCMAADSDSDEGGGDAVRVPPGRRQEASAHAMGRRSRGAGGISVLGLSPEVGWVNGSFPPRDCGPTGPCATDAPAAASLQGSPIAVGDCDANGSSRARRDSGRARPEPS